MSARKSIVRAMIISAVLIPTTHDIRADDTHCAVISAGAETDAATGSIQNLGQVVIGRASNAAVILHAGAIPCLAIHASCLLGDVNGDGRIDGLDIHPYTRVTLTSVGTPRELCAAGIDVSGFVAILLQ